MTKREIEQKNTEDDDDDDDFGPMPVSDTTINDDVDQQKSRRNKKMKKLEFEQVYLDNLPSAQMYEMSFMHRYVVVSQCHHISPIAKYYVVIM